MHVAILGPGRLGRTLVRLLDAAGARVDTWRRGDPPPRAPIRWITVPDAAVPEVAAHLPPGGVTLHASGALGVEVLRPHRPAGSLHPLQSFPGPEVAIPPLEGVPAAVAGDPEAVAVGFRLARLLGMAPFEVPGDRRLYHAAAVMAGNFATVLLDRASTVLAAAGVPREEAPGILAPLALASIAQAARAGPARALTGPYARGDESTIAAHRRALADGCPAILPLYDALAAAARALAASGGSSRD